MQFEWDREKHESNIRRRGFGFDFAARIFAGETLVWSDERRDYGETRIRAIGMVEGLLLHVVFTDRADVRRMISARPASRRERRAWQDRR